MLPSQGLLRGVLSRVKVCRPGQWTRSGVGAGRKEDFFASSEFQTYRVQGRARQNSSASCGRRKLGAKGDPLSVRLPTKKADRQLFVSEVAVQYGINPD